MTLRKRKADSASPAESLHESPHKRARSETTNDTADKRSGNAYSSDDVSPKGSEEVSSLPTSEDRSLSPVNRRPSGKSLCAISKVSKKAAISSNTASAAPTEIFAPDQDLPRSWEQANAGDQLIVRSKINKLSWANIMKAWEKLTGETPAEGALQDRYERIKRLVIRPASDLGRRSTKARTVDGAPGQAVSRRAKPRHRKPCSPRLKTPMKRNTDRGKRKTSVKYTDSTTDDDEPFAAPTEPIITASTKRNAGRAAKVNRCDPEWLVTNEKSPLADEDLHAEFSDPKTYEDFTKSDWESLRETLPPNVPVNPDGYSIPMTFFKYDPDFRRGIREFQEDLAAGRLDRKWQADAAQAMEERALGEFDAYKENQFEAFWGQKQKLNYDALAGESRKIKLEVLIQNKIFRVGDYFSYSRVFGSGKNRVLIEKDCKIVEIDGKALTLTFAIPPGQRKYSRRMFESGPPGDTKPEGKATMDGTGEQSPTGVGSRINGAKANVDTESCGDEGLQPSEKGNGALMTKKMAGNGSLLDVESKKAESQPDGKAEKDGTGESTQLNDNEVEANIKRQDHETHEATTSEGGKVNGALIQNNGGIHSSANDSEDEDIPCTISGLTPLENRILDVHGTFKSEDTRINNAWKDFRGIRNHQDLGSLFEMREEFYVHKYPQIVNAARRKR